MTSRDRGGHGERFQVNPGTQDPRGSERIRAVKFLTQVMDESSRPTRPVHGMLSRVGTSGGMGGDAGSGSGGDQHHQQSVSVLAPMCPCLPGVTVPTSTHVLGKSTRIRCDWWRSGVGTTTTDYVGCDHTVWATGWTRYRTGTICTVR